MTNSTKTRPAVDKKGDAEKYPYKVVKPYANDVYFRSWIEARNSILKDIDNIKSAFQGLNAAEKLEACNVLLGEAQRIPQNRGASIAGIVDPETGLKYRADLVKRDAI